MEQRTRKIENEILLEEYRTLLETVEQLPLLISGNSMSPFLVHGRDTVYLTKIRRPLQRGDIALYRRKNGAYILHRVCAVDGETFSMIGDAQTDVEHGIARDQIIAVVCSAVRKGRRLAPGCFWWDFFAKFWLRVIPARPILIHIYRTVKKPFGRNS